MTPSTKSLHAIGEPINPQDSAWAKIGAHLESSRLRIQEEITHYPPPIPACDAHFNHLLEERARIGQELNRMRDTAGEGGTPGDCMQRLEQFIRSSNCMSDEAKREIRSSLNEQHPGQET